MPQMITENSDAELDVSEIPMAFQCCFTTAYKSRAEVDMCGVAVQTFRKLRMRVTSSRIRLRPRTIEA